MLSFHKGNDLSIAVYTALFCDVPAYVMYKKTKSQWEGVFPCFSTFIFPCSMYLLKGKILTEL